MDGAHDITVSIATFKHFIEAGNNIVFRVAACFENMQILGRVYLSQETRVPSAQYQVAKVIPVSSSRMVDANMTKARLNNFRDYSPKYNHKPANAHEDAIVASFLAHFTPVPNAFSVTRIQSKS